MEDAISEITLIIARESPYLALAAVCILVGVAIIFKLIPPLAEWVKTRAEVMRKREARKREESMGRAHLEGQWYTAMQQSNILHEKTNELTTKLMDKLDRDAEQSARIEEKVDSMTVIMGGLCTEIKVLEERMVRK